MITQIIGLSRLKTILSELSNTTCFISVIKKTRTH